MGVSVMERDDDCVYGRNAVMRMLPSRLGSTWEAEPGLSGLFFPVTVTGPRPRARGTVPWRRGPFRRRATLASASLRQKPPEPRSNAGGDYHIDGDDDRHSARGAPPLACLAHLDSSRHAVRSGVADRRQARPPVPPDCHARKRTISCWPRRPPGSGRGAGALAPGPLNQRKTAFVQRIITP